MIDGSSPLVAVQRFAAALREIRERLFDDLYPIADVADLLAAVRSRRELPSDGLTSGGINYSVHGAGCRMTAPDGREVDVDLVTDPAMGNEVEAFDAWRVRSFLDETADEGYTDEEIGSACADLARAGVLRQVVAGRWYALADNPPEPVDPTR